MSAPVQKTMWLPEKMPLGVWTCHWLPLWRMLWAGVWGWRVMLGWRSRAWMRAGGLSHAPCCQYKPLWAMGMPAIWLAWAGETGR